MQLSSRTIEILKNFYAINPLGLVFPAGSTIATQPPTAKTLVAVAEIDEVIEDRFAIYDVAQLYSAISVFEKPQLYVDGIRAIVSDVSDKKAGQFVINTAAESIVKAPREMNFPDDNCISFEMTKEAYNRIMKGVGIVQVPSVAIIGDGQQLVLSGLDKNNSGINQFNIPIAESTSKANFAMTIENLNKLMRGMDYVVSINPRGIARFQGDRIVYYIAAESE